MLLGLSIDLIVELLLGALLTATVYFCWRLERRLRNLRNDQAELVGTVRALSGAITVAQLSLAGLRSAAKEADETLGRKVQTARALADELALLNGAGERIAVRMENARDATPKPIKQAAPALRAVR
jgi:hypothetical protein